jgi:thioredoxin-related protein
MMKNIVLIGLFGFLTSFSFGQEKFELYKPEADAQKELENAISQAAQEKKHVFIQVGGNWCGWCKLFHELTTSDEELKKYINENYVVLHLNYSKENKNLETLVKLEYPQRFGFPVFVILDGTGKRIHTQSSGYLEEGKGHSKKLVMDFLQSWSPAALNPELYKN